MQFVTESFCHIICTSRWASAGNDDLLGVGARYGVHVSGVPDAVEVGHSDGSYYRDAVFNQRDVHGPVQTTGGELAGAIERVNDPHSILGQTFFHLIWSLFGKHTVVGTVIG